LWGKGEEKCPSPNNVFYQKKFLWLLSGRRANKIIRVRVGETVYVCIYIKNLFKPFFPPLSK